MGPIPTPPHRSIRLTCDRLADSARPETRLPLLVRPCAFLIALACLSPANALAAAATTTTLAVAAAGTAVTTVAPQTAVTLTASVTSGGTAVSPGVVNFCDASAPNCNDIHLLGTAQLTASGTAVLRLTPSLGGHSYKAVFAGTTHDQPSASAAQPLQVGSPGGSPFTETFLYATGGPGNYTLTETLTVNGMVPPTGSIAFNDTSNAGYTLATAPLVGVPAGLSFATPPSPATDIGPVGVVVADFNGDGKADLAVSSYEEELIDQPGALTILLGNGDGTFTATAVSPMTNAYPFFLAAGDFNGDGIPDLAVTSFSDDGGAIILLGNGDGTFTVGNPLASDQFSGPIVSGDFNGDGNADLAFTVYNGIQNEYQMAVFLGNGDGTFTQVAAQPQVGTEPASIVGADLNGDGKLDLVVSGGPNQPPSFTPPPPNTLTILLGNGDGTFTRSPTSAPTMPLAGTLVTAEPCGSVVIADFNGDGIPDLAASQALSNAVTVFPGNGDGTFGTPSSPGTNFSVGIAPGYMSVADFKGDGNADIAIAADSKGSAPLTILLGAGDGTFTTFTGPDTGTEPLQTAIGYFDGDGRPDVAVANYLDDTVSIFLTRFGATATATADNISVVGMGQHLVDGSYPGDANNAASISNTVSLTAEPVATTLTFSANPAGSSVGQPVTLTATIAPDAAQNHTPAGAIDLYAGGTLLVAGSFANGVASFTTSALPPCANILTAAFVGDTNFLPSTAPELDYFVAPAPSMTVTLSASSLELKAGHHTTLDVMVSGTGFSGPVVLTATPLPQYGTATFTPQTVQIASSGCQTGSQTSSLYLDTDALLGFYSQNKQPMAPGHAQDHAPYLAGFRWELLGLSALALLPILRRCGRWPGLLLVLIASAATFLSLSGCANRYPATIPPGTYVIQINAAAQGTAVTASAPLTLVVTP